MLGSGYVQRPDPSQAAGSAGIGPELIVNGDMGSATGWNLGANWAIAGGVATKTAGAANNIDQAVLTVGKQYRMYFTIVSISAGTITPSLGSGTVGPGFTTAGDYSFTGFCTGSTAAAVQGDAASAAVVDNVSVRQLGA
jgi:hypothetical protein